MRNKDISFFFLSQLILPPVVLALPFLVLYKELALLDTSIGLILLYTLMVLPIVVWVMRDQFDTIPIELEEAALVDGFSVWGAFLRIVLPIALPGMVAAFILSLILCWNEYFFAALLTSTDAKTLPVMVASQTGSQGINWWSMAALSTAAIAPLVLVGIFLERYIVKRHDRGCREVARMERSAIAAIPLAGDTSFRERAIEPERTALLLIDLQKGEYNPDKIAAEPEHAYLFDRISDVVIPNGRKLLAACRAAGVEVIYTVIEALTLDGRDRSLDYKVSGIFCAKGSWQAEVLDELKPLPNEIVIPKTSSSLFNSTNFEYVLRNLGIEYVMVMGIVTDQCVETAVRDGCDRGFLMTLIDDACATHSLQRHREALTGFKGYCRVRRVAQILDELKEATGVDAVD